MSKTDVLCFKLVSLAAVFAFLGVNLHAMGCVWSGGFMLFVAGVCLVLLVSVFCEGCSSGKKTDCCSLAVPGQVEDVSLGHG